MSLYYSGNNILRPDWLYGTLLDNSLNGGGTTMNSNGLATAPVVPGSYQLFFKVILDPQAEFGSPEVVYVTTHGGSASTATVVRAQEGTVVRDHQAGEFWITGPTGIDFDAMPGGIIDDVIVTTQQSGFNSETAVTGLTSTQIYPGGRYVRISVILQVGEDTGDATEVYNCFIKGTPAGGYMQQQSQTLPGRITRASFTPWIVFEPPAGSNTYFVSIQGGSATTLQTNPDTYNEAHLLIEDLGLAP